MAAAHLWVSAYLHRLPICVGRCYPPEPSLHLTVELLTFLSLLSTCFPIESVLLSVFLTNLRSCLCFNPFSIILSRLLTHLPSSSCNSPILLIFTRYVLTKSVVFGTNVIVDMCEAFEVLLAMKYCPSYLLN